MYLMWYTFLNELTNNVTHKSPMLIICCSLTSGIFKGALCEAPPWPDPDRRDFCNYFGLFLAQFRDKIAATSDQMRFLGRKML